MEFPDKPETLYWYSLGKFVHRYAEIEAILHQVLRIESDVTRATAYAIFSGTRVSQAISNIRRIHEGRGTEPSPWLEKAFERIPILTDVRDNVLHQGLTIKDNEAYVTNRWRNLPRRVWKFPITVADLDALEIDCITVQGCLTIHWIEKRYKNHPTAERWREVAQQSWHYKPPKRVPLADTPSRKPLKR